MNTGSIPPLFISANFMHKKRMVQIFIEALKVGVRGFDTAREYGCERKVGEAIRIACKETGVSRDEIFIQTRISNEEIIKGNIKKEIDISLNKMRLDYLDCFMFHWPTPKYYIDRWKELTDLQITEYNEKIRNLGICNCRQRHLDEIIQNNCILPNILQIEVTPFWQCKKLTSFCQTKNITIQAFSPLCKMIEPIRSNNILNSLAIKYNVSIPQLILRWNYQRNIIPISLTSRPSRVRSNFDIYDFIISEEDMKLIETLDCGYKYHLESATCLGF